MFVYMLALTITCVDGTPGSRLVQKYAFPETVLQEVGRLAKDSAFNETCYVSEAEWWSEYRDSEAEKSQDD